MPLPKATIRPLANPAPQAEVRQAAATTPGRIGKPSAVDALMATFNVPHLPVREQAVWALGEIASAWLAAGGNP